MDASSPSAETKHLHQTSNHILIKGTITGVLILCLLIPIAFISGLVEEREERHQQIAKEVSSRWASEQTLTGPFLYVPYSTAQRQPDGKIIQLERHFWIAPEQLKVNGSIEHQIRERSIYKVLLYRAQLSDSGLFELSKPVEANAADIRWHQARICMGISDFKGIEERMSISIDGKDVELSPGLPSKDLAAVGLSAPLDLSRYAGKGGLSFNMKIKMRGSGLLHFLPLSGNSSYVLKSTWPDPSFDGNSLPGERVVTREGFLAKWTFNKANLPFGTIMHEVDINDLQSLAFGVTMLQPADHYAKTERSVKYAILFIGLTIGLFFIIELIQKKPMHPVQYVLAGLALVIFYLLLLSISEFVQFDIAYLIASTAVIMMITLYARSHFSSWRAALAFFGVLTMLYGFIFILIRLEDTALLVGSIGLFIVLATVMYASRKIRWYGSGINPAI